MKTQLIVIVFVFTFAGLAVAGQIAQENRATPQIAAQQNGSGSKKPMNRSGETSTPKSTEVSSTDQVQSPPQTMSPNLETSLVGLTEAVTKLVDRQAAKESTFSKDFKYVIDVIT